MCWILSRSRHKYIHHTFTQKTQAGNPFSSGLTSQGPTSGLPLSLNNPIACQGFFVCPLQSPQSPTPASSLISARSSSRHGQFLPCFLSRAWHSSFCLYILLGPPKFPSSPSLVQEPDSPTCPYLPKLSTRPSCSPQGHLSWGDEQTLVCFYTATAQVSPCCTLTC